MQAPWAPPPLTTGRAPLPYVETVMGAPARPDSASSKPLPNQLPRRSRIRGPRREGPRVHLGQALPRGGGGRPRRGVAPSRRVDVVGVGRRGRRRQRGAQGRRRGGRGRSGRHGRRGQQGRGREGGQHAVLQGVYLLVGICHRSGAERPRTLAENSDNPGEKDTPSGVPGPAGALPIGRRRPALRSRHRLDLRAAGRPEGTPRYPHRVPGSPRAAASAGGAGGGRRWRDDG